MDLPMLGTEEKTELSKFQVSLVDKTNKALHPVEYPRINRFFENIDDRNSFIAMFESNIVKSGGHLMMNPLTHALFVSFYIIDKNGNKGFEVVVYH